MAMLILMAATCTAMPAQAGNRKATKVTWHREYKRTKERMIVQGKDAKNRKVWKYKTKWYVKGDDRTTKCRVRKNKVYILADGKIKVFRKSDKKKLWTTKTKIRAGYVYKFDKEDNLYLTGYYNTEIYKISSKGKKRWKKDSYKTGNYWPSKIIDVDRQVSVLYDCGRGDEEGKYNHQITFNAESGRIINYY